VLSGAALAEYELFFASPFFVICCVFLCIEGRVVCAASVQAGEDGAGTFTVARGSSSWPSLVGVMSDFVVNRVCGMGRMDERFLSSLPHSR